MGLKETSIAFLLIFIFSFAFINYAVGFANDNNAEVNIGTSDTFSEYLSTSESDMNDYTVETSDSLGNFYEQEVPGDSESTGTGATFQPKEGSSITATLNILGIIYKTIFGGGNQFNVIFTAITTVVVFIGGLYWWKFIKGGNPN